MCAVYFSSYYGEQLQMGAPLMLDLPNQVSGPGAE